MLGLNISLPLLYMYKNIIYMNSIENRMNQFVIGYNVNPKLHGDRVFIEQGEKWLETHLMQVHSMV